MGRDRGGNGDQDKGRAKDHYEEQKNVERWTRQAREAAGLDEDTQNGNDDDS